MLKDAHKTIRKLDGANMDIDLTTSKEKISWEQDKCPWNEKEKGSKHKCTVKNISICDYFCGIEFVDTVLCCYPHKNPRDDINKTDKTVIKKTDFSKGKDFEQVAKELGI